MSSPTPDQTRDTRAAAWGFVFSRYFEKKEAAFAKSRPDDAKGSQHDRARVSIP